MSRSRAACGAAGHGPAVAQRTFNGRLGKWDLGLCIVAVLVMGLMLLANSMAKTPGRDEQMYCTAAVLLARGLIPYRDFAYAAQPPYHPLLLGALYRVTGTNHYLLAGRLLSVVCDVGVVVALLLIYVRAAGRLGLWAGLGAGLLYVTNSVVCYANGYAWNHDLVQVLVMAALVFALYAGQGLWGPALVGLLCGLATFARITTVLVIPVLGLGLYLKARSTRRPQAIAMAWFAGGLAAASIWPLWVALQAPRAFWLDLVVIPKAYARWLSQAGMTLDKLELTLNCLGQPEYLATLVLAVLLVFLGRPRVYGLRLGLAMGLAVVFGLIALLPPTMWPQYWAIPVPFLLGALAIALDAASRSSHPRGLLACLAIWVVAGSSLIHNQQLVGQLGQVGRPDQWVPLAMHQQFSALLAGVDRSGPVLTLAPLWALESGLDIYPQLSCGSIIYRAADGLDAGDRRTARVIGPADIDDLIEQQPPSAVLVGVEDARFSFLEGPLLRAVGPDWTSRGWPQGPTVWYRSGRSLTP